MDQMEATGRLPAVPPPRSGRSAPPERRRTARRRAVSILVMALVAAGVVVTLWAVETGTRKGKVGRNVTLGGADIGGLDRAGVAAAVADLSRTYAGAQVVVDAEGGGFQATAPELGLSVVEETTTTGALTVGRTGFVLTRIWDWARAFVVDRPAPVTIAVDERSIARIVTERDPRRTPPTEPSLTVKADRVAPAPGKPGQGISSPSVLAALQKAGPKGLPLRISVDRDELPPRFPIEEAQRLADRAEQISAAGLPVTAGPASGTIPAATLRGWFRSQVTATGLQLAVDGSKAPAALEELFPEPVVAPVNAGFTVSGGKVSVTPSKAGTACCGAEASTLITNALLNRSSTAAVTLPLKTMAASRDEEAARKLGITEPVGTFTTNHGGGEPRVKNIHRIADMIQGAVIAPGATFSVNDYVGRRTTANGFVPAPIIDENYKFTEDVGGGISQFATTIFNAAFFAGLDIPSYYMHGIYIARYPYGRESTISFPSPDVRIRNNTPYGVLIWPTYSETSITVTMYSTRFVTGEQTNQTTEKKGVCTAVTTERTRTYVDGRKATDKFSGLYSPEEGVKCE